MSNVSVATFIKAIYDEVRLVDSERWDASRRTREDLLASNDRGPMVSIEWSVLLWGQGVAIHWLYCCGCGRLPGRTIVILPA